MEYDWEILEEFIDDIETKFIRLKNGPFDYKFITKEGDIDFCYKQQLIDWKVQVSKVL